MTLDILCGNIRDYIDGRLEALKGRKKCALRHNKRRMMSTTYQCNKDASDANLIEINKEIKKLERIRKIFEEEATENDAGSQEGESLR